jgi:hypothetical protein
MSKTAARISLAAPAAVSIAPIGGGIERAAYVVCGPMGGVRALTVH